MTRSDVPAAGGVIRAVIADDELSAREVIRSFVEREPKIEIVGEAAHGDAAVEQVRALSPDLLFLDVQMPDRDGFGVLEALGEDVPRSVVFVTAHDEYALRAFEVRALDYLLKPFGYARFHEAVDRVLRSLAGEEALDARRTIETLADVAAGPRAAGSIVNDAGGTASSRIGVRRGSRTIVIDVSDIDWIEAADDYSRLHTAGTAHLVTTRLRDLEERLPPSFFRIHRSAIVNLERIGELRRDSNGGGLALLRDGVRLRVARTRWEGLETALGL